MKNKLILIVAPLVIVALVIAGVFLFHKNSSNLVSSNNDNDGDNDSNTATAATATPSGVVMNYKDGTYKAEGDYVIHLGPKHIGVSVTLKNNLITDATVTNEADDPTSMKFQNEFISGFKTQVIGKNINDVHVTKVSGSSLTPNGFNDALTKIEAQAKM